MSDSTFLERHGVLRFLVRSIKIAITTAVTLIVLGTAGLMGGYFYFAHDLPNIQTMEDYRPPVVSEVFARDGTKIGEFWRERRLLATYDEIPLQLIRAFLAAEDSRFFEHRGVDPYGIARAIWEDVKAREFVQGASTITQQITRSILLTRERKVGRKVREAILATRLERNLTKEQILLLYLNQIYLGNRANGVKAAAENYFHKSLKDISLAEAAMIGGLSRAPYDDSPVNSAERAKARQRYVLERMRELGYINAQQFEQAWLEPLTVYVAGVDKEYNFRQTPYFTEHVRRLLVEQYGEDALYEGGLKIETTVDLAAYQAAVTALRNGLEIVDHRTRGWLGPLETGVVDETQIAARAEAVHRQVVMLVSDPVLHIPAPLGEALFAGPTPVVANYNYRAVIIGNEGKGLRVRVGHNDGMVAAEQLGIARGRRLPIGDVIEVRPLDDTGQNFALVQTPELQGALFSMEVQSGAVRAMVGGYDYLASEFNRATQALRQPGSTFKPFVYGAALDKGFTYDTPVADSPVAYRVGINEVWAPKNYGGKFSGAGVFASHITFSRNVPTVKIGHAIGLHYLAGFVRKFGLTSPIEKYLSMSLGANGVYVNELVNAYVTFGNYGRRPPQLFITKVTDKTGKVLQEHVLTDEAVPSLTLPAGAVVPDNINPALWIEGEKTIAKDGLQLDPQEIQVLYGARIPEGHTITPQTAYLMVGLLQRVVKSGTGTRVLAVGKPIAGKTGTTNDETDAWFIGFTPKLGAGVWVGYDQVRKIGRGEQGGRTAAPIFVDYMKAVLADEPAYEFTPPEGFPMEKIASLPGGSAIYWTGGMNTQLREEAEELATRRVIDRSVDFYEDDLGDF